MSCLSFNFTTLHALSSSLTILRQLFLQQFYRFFFRWCVTNFCIQIITIKAKCSNKPSMSFLMIRGIYLFSFPAFRTDIIHKQSFFFQHFVLCFKKLLLQIIIGVLQFVDYAFLLFNQSKGIFHKLLRI